MRTQATPLRPGGRTPLDADLSSGLDESRRQVLSDTLGDVFVLVDQSRR